MAVSSGVKPLRPSPPDLDIVNWRAVIPVLLIAGLGFFVDVYDMVLFMLVRIPSLTSLGLSPQEVLPVGISLSNLQMAGMLVGGLGWGVLGDKKGRRSILFGSIALYSIATLLNGFVTSVPVYAILRFLTGMGLAGEVGAAMTIASEVMPAKYRAYGTGMVVAFAALGAIAASFISSMLFWRLTYITAGIAGLLLLIVRMSVKETAIFNKSLHTHDVKRGSLRLLFLSKERLMRLLVCMGAGSPNWYVIGVLVTFAPEVCSNSANSALISVSAVLMCYCIGEAIGEAACGITSQLLHSRRIAVAVFVLCSFVLSLALLHCPVQMYHLLCIPIGFFGGFWGVVVTSAAEQFGTNLRSTATTLVPCLIRSTTIPMTLVFGALSTAVGAHTGALLTGLVCYGCSAVSILFMEETFGKDLDFLEV